MAEADFMLVREIPVLTIPDIEVEITATPDQTERLKAISRQYYDRLQKSVHGISAMKRSKPR